MDYENVIFEIKDEIAVLTINRPKKMNALNSDTVGEIKDVLKKVKTERKARILIITGSGDKAFVAGADIGEFTEIGIEAGFDFSRNGQEMTQQLESLGIPTIAAVNGLALGGGCELAMGCTFRIISENAKFGLPELGLGVIPGYGGTQRLARIIGKSRATWLMLTGDMMGAEEALRVGLANLVVKPEDLMDTVFKTAKKICQKAPLAVSYALTAVHHGTETDLETGLVLEAALTNLILMSDDKVEGVSSFLEKRKPTFKGK